MANTSISLVNLDFDEIKSNLKQYLKNSNSAFQDVDYEGSNISQLLDVFSYNTFLNAYYLNMVASEMFLDTAVLRDSVVSHAKELNYLPRSFRSAEAQISFTVTPSISMTSLLVPKGTSFTTKVGSNNYSFSTDQATTLDLNANGQFEANLTVYEGSYLTDTFVYNASNTSQRFVLSNPTVDTRSLSVTVVEDGGSSVVVYTRASSMLGLTNTSQVYFLQPAENSQYEVVFGDGVIGRLPKNGSTVMINYRACNGELPNGARVFDIDGPIGGQANISPIKTASIAAGGAVNEDINSIKLNATRHYQNQERAVTASDFETLLTTNFPEIQAVSAYGGEDAIPPQYGKVFISVDDANMNGAPDSAKARYYAFIKPKSPLSIDPVFVDPDFIYADVQVLVRYDITQTTLQTSDISTLVKSAVSNYAQTNLNGFKKTLRYSRLLQQIAQSHPSIISVDLYVIPSKKLYPIIGKPYNALIDFGFPLSTTYTMSWDDYVRTDIKAVYSVNFTYGGRLCNIQDDRNGKVGIYTAEGADKDTLLLTIGTVNYDTGRVEISVPEVGYYSGPHIHMYVNPAQKDIPCSKNYILSIDDGDVNVRVEAIKA